MPGPFGLFVRPVQRGRPIVVAQPALAARERLQRDARDVRVDEEPRAQTAQLGRVPRGQPALLRNDDGVDADPSVEHVVGNETDHDEVRPVLEAVVFEQHALRRREIAVDSGLDELDPRMLSVSRVEFGFGAAQVGFLVGRAPTGRETVAESEHAERALRLDQRVFDVAQPRAVVLVVVVVFSGLGAA